MWESPISILRTKIETQIDDDVMKVVSEYDIDIDKHRLLEILQGDRSSYDKGYADGKREVCERIIEKLYAKQIENRNKCFVYTWNVGLDQAIEIVNEEM